MIAFIGKIIAFFVLPIVIAIQIISNLFDKRYRQPLYHFKSQYIHKRIGKYESEYLKIQNHHKSEKNKVPHHENPAQEVQQSIPNQTDSQKKDPKDITVVFIPGNPGYLRFYDVFLNELANKFKFAHTIYGICHAGHLGHQIKGKRIHAGVGDNPFGWSANVLREQIEHKYNFIQYVLKKHPNTQLVLVGHSIGAYIVLNLMERIPKANILHSYLLFPTIEQMNNVPSHFIANFMTRFPTRWFIASFIEIVRMLPDTLKRILIHFALKGQEEDECIEDQVESILLLTDFTTFLNIARMAQSEFEQVRKRQNDLLTSFEQQITLYYGKTDGWTPFKLYESIKKEFPNLDCRLDNNGIPHAFVTGESRRMAGLLFEWIEQKKKEQQQQQEQQQ